MMAKDRNLRFQRPSDVAEALAPFADAQAARTDTSDLQIPKESHAHAVAAPSALAEAQGSPARRQWRLRITILGLLGLVALSALALSIYRKYILPLTDEERPEIVAVYRKVSPVADGAIGVNEYGPGVTITWTAENTLATFEHGLTGDLTQNKPPDDLSVTLHTAYSDTALFFAFHVRDQFVDAQEEDRDTPHQNDGVEIFIDGDRVPNDFNSGTMADANSKKIFPSEGFQLLADAAGHQFTRAQGFGNADWKAAARRTADGYIVEIEIPLALIDTQDGPAYAPPGPGSVLNFAMAVTDNDAAVRHQVSYAYLRTRNTNTSPWIGGENSWKFAIKLEPKWSLFGW
jgi:hypothetical protein